MQPDQIDLSVDVANVGSPVSEVYTRYTENTHRTDYIGVNFLPEMRDQFTIYRTPASKSGNFKGVSKSAVKFTNDVDVPGVDSSTTLTAPIILEASFSIPVGTTAADVLHLRQRLIAALDDDSFMDALNIQLMV